MGPCDPASRAADAQRLYLRPGRAGAGTFDDHIRPGGPCGVYATRVMGTAGVDLYYLATATNSAAFEQGKGQRSPPHHRRALLWQGGWLALERGGHRPVRPVHHQHRRRQHRRLVLWLRSRPQLCLGAVETRPDPALQHGQRRQVIERQPSWLNALFPGAYFGELSPIGPYNLVNVQPVAVFQLEEPGSAPA
jgi:hypothetical protein